MISLLVRGDGDLPLLPDPDHARHWAEQELAKPEYAATHPTWFDRVAKAVFDFVLHLFDAKHPPGWDAALGVAAVLVLSGLVVAAVLIWGRPHAIRRSRPLVAELFGDDDARSAAVLRAAAARAAAASDWDAAIVLRMRAIARGAAERGVVALAPGATVHAFARDAGRAFPAHRAALDSAADAFDDVRYLRRPGTAARYEAVAACDDALVAAQPVDADGVLA